MKKIVKFGSGLFDNAKSLIEGAADVVTSGAADLANVLGSPFTKERVPAYLIPTGSGPDEYEILFDFESFLLELRAGRLVKPEIEVWSGRDDISRVFLRERLREAFLQQLAEAKENIEKLRTVIAEKERLEKEVHEDVAVGGIAQAVAAIIGILLSTSVLVNVFLFIFALVSGTDGVKGLIKLLLAHADQLFGGNEEKSELRELEDALKEREAEIEKIIDTLVIHIHPELTDSVNVFYTLNQLPELEIASDEQYGPLPAHVCNRANELCRKEIEKKGKLSE